MENRLFGILLTVSTLTLPVCVIAQETDTSRGPLVQPELERTTIDEAKINTDDFEIGAYYGLLSIEDFGVDDVYGGRIGYHVTDNAFFELSIGMSQAGPTSYERLSGAAKLLTDSERDFTYYSVSIGFDALPGEVFVFNRYAFNSAMYVVGGVGSTRFARDDRFTISLGVGYRLVITDWVTLNLDARDHIFETDLFGEDQTTHNLEVTTGMTLFF